MYGPAKCGKTGGPWCNYTFRNNGLRNPSRKPSRKPSRRPSRFGGVPNVRYVRVNKA